jgi:predicted nucleic acid-binding protein
VCFSSRLASTSTQCSRRITSRFTTRLWISRTILLRQFCGRVVVPDAVEAELSASSAPAVVREWLGVGHPWVDVVPVPPESVEGISDTLGRGERAAIALAESMAADLT